MPIVQLKTMIEYFTKYCNSNNKYVIVTNLLGGVHGFEKPELVRSVTPRPRSGRGVTARAKVFQIHEYRPRGW